MKNRAIKIVRLVVRNALAHIPKDDARHFLQQSGISKMKEHAVPLVRFRTNVFKEKNTRAINLRSIWCPKRLREDRDTAAIQQTFRATGSKDAKTVFNAQ